MSKTKDIKLWVKNLKKYYPTIENPIKRIIRGQKYVKAVDDISFEIQRGEVFGLVGESGSGKTTVGENLLMLQKPTEGHLYYEINNETKQEIIEAEKNGNKEKIKEYNQKYSLKERKNLRKLRKDIQMIFQDPSAALNPSMTVFESIMHPAKIHKIENSKEERKEKVYEMMKEVGLTPIERFEDAYPRDLSGGERQRVIIARAMILEPTFLVADEPVAMLDMSIRSKILDLLMKLKKEFNLTILFITHDLATAKLICNRIGIMYLGKIMELGETKEIFNNPKHPYTKSLLRAIPKVDPKEKERDKKLPEGEIPDPIDMPQGCRYHPRCLDATSKCGWGPRDLKEYLENNLLDIYTEEEIEEMDISFEEKKQKNELVIPEKPKMWGYIKNESKKEIPLMKAIKEINQNENKMKIKFKEPQEPKRKDTDGRTACFYN